MWLVLDFPFAGITHTVVHMHIQLSGRVRLIGSQKRTTKLHSSVSSLHSGKMCLSDSPGGVAKCYCCCWSPTELKIKTLNTMKQLFISSLRLRVHFDLVVADHATKWLSGGGVPPTLTKRGPLLRAFEMSRCFGSRLIVELPVDFSKTIRLWARNSYAR